MQPVHCPVYIDYVFQLFICEIRHGKMTLYINFQERLGRGTRQEIHNGAARGSGDLESGGIRDTTGRVLLLMRAPQSRVLTLAISGGSWSQGRVMR